MSITLDREACYRAVSSRDRRFDGIFFIAVRTTGIYCRPSCPARTPALRNVEFHPTAAAAQAAGFRACKRCLPDATPGSPEWDVAADVAGRAMRLISDGVVDRDGVDGLAARVGYTARHLNRLLTAELGAGPLALARARRAQTARVLIETTDLTFAEIAFASGFASIRQFNETIREVYALSPSDLRGRRGRGQPSTGTVTMRLAVRTPYAGRDLLAFLALRAVPGVEAAGDGWYARTLALPHGTALVRIEVDDHDEPGQTVFVHATFALDDLRDTSAGVERVRRLLDADCDPVAVDEALGRDPLLRPLVEARPGLRVPGHVDGNEIAVRAVLGQQVTVVAARTIAARLTAELGKPVARADGELTHLFPDVATLATLTPEDLPMPRSRGRALVELCRALADGRVVLDRGAGRDDTRAALLAIPGIGPWTADYIALRALGHPDVFLPTDIGIRDALRNLGRDPASASELGEGWRPWRSYAQLHLWRTLTRDLARDLTTDKNEEH
jgi:AraC family transcriptional regulator, regulatory protein of adaptative response / DNA-3-methyladenine glycosylase II